jgi:hypothetical protein
MTRQLAAGDAAEVLVDERPQRLEGVAVTLPVLAEQLCDVVRQDGSVAASTFATQDIKFDRGERARSSFPTRCGASWDVLNTAESLERSVAADRTRFSVAVLGLGDGAASQQKAIEVARRVAEVL